VKVAVIGRTEILYKTLKLLLEANHEIGLIVTSKEAPEYTKSAFEFEQIAKKNKIKYIYTSRLDDYVRDIKDASCDIAVSLNYSSIISQKVIDLFPLGILNAHGGDLPKYRGNACQAWAILNGETRIGLCIHSMIGGEVDNGNIIDRKFLDIDINTKITYIYQWFAEVIPNMFLESINKLANNPLYVLESKNQDPSRAMRCYPRLPEDGKIDWRKTNLEILRLINATNKPYCGAYCEYDNNKFIIWDAELYNDDEKYLSECGQVCSIEQDGSIIVITGNGKLKINTIEYMGFVGSPGEKIKSIRKRLR